MWISKRTLLSVVVGMVAVLSLALAVGAVGKRGHGGDDHGRGQNRGRGADLIDATLAPSLPTDPAFHGVAAGGAPWVLRRGEVTLSSRGRLELRVRGLVIPGAPGNGTPGPVTTVSASLYCGADADTAPADTTASVPISRSGNARIRDRSFDVPDTCLAPVILVHPNGDATHYIAVDGRRD
jgi:hypothetical protein